MDLVTAFLSDAPSFVESVLRLSTSTDVPQPSPSPSGPPQTASDNTLVIVLASVIAFLVFFVACHVVGILAIWKYRKQR